METIIHEVVKYPESLWRRTWVIPYNDGAWVVGECGGKYGCLLDKGGNIVLLFDKEELAY